MRRAPLVAVTLVACLSLLAGCGDDGTTEPEATFSLTFTGDATFQGAHGGQTIHVAVFEQGTGEMVASTTGTVAADAAPTFDFTFQDVLAEGQSYNLDYWIDSNFGGGTEGSCDPPETDHQWRIEIPSVTQDVVIDDTHRPTETEPVCSTSSESGPTNPGY